MFSRLTNNGDLPLRLLLDRFSLFERGNFYRGAREADDVPDVGALGADDGANSVVRNVEEDCFLLVGPCLRARVRPGTLVGSCLRRRRCWGRWPAQSRTRHPHCRPGIHLGQRSAGSRCRPWTSLP
jgi:hypothetical protein